MSDLAAFQAVFVTCRQVRDEVHFIFTVPTEKGQDYLRLIGGFPKPGESRWCVIARYQTEDKALREPPPHEKSSRPNLENGPARPHNPYSRRAGILACDQTFQKWINAPEGDPGSYAASIIRGACKVTSRKDILPGSEAAVLFDKLQNEFIAWRDGPRHGAS